MRCISCDKLLSDFEATRRSVQSNDYVEMCNDCFYFAEDEIATLSREDLRSESDNFIKEQEYEQDWRLGFGEAGNTELD